MKFNKNSVWFTGIIIAILAGIVTYYSSKRRGEDIVTLINNADRLLDKNKTEDALAIYNDVLKTVSESKEPELYARIKNNEGACYFNLATVSNEEDNLKKAIHAYEAVLKIYTFEKYPVNYAITQNNLGSAYGTLALIRDKEENIKKAIRAYEEALKVYTKEVFPLYYERIMSNMKQAKQLMRRYEKD